MSAYLAATLRGTYTARFMLIRILTLSMVWGTTFFLSFLSTRSGRLLSVSFSTLVPSRLSINQICVKFGQLNYCKENVYLLFFFQSDSTNIFQRFTVNIRRRHTLCLEQLPRWWHLQVFSDGPASGISWSPAPSPTIIRGQGQSTNCTDFI